MNELSEGVQLKAICWPEEGSAPLEVREPTIRYPDCAVSMVVAMQDERPWVKVIHAKGTTRLYNAAFLESVDLA